VSIFSIQIPNNALAFVIDYDDHSRQRQQAPFMPAVPANSVGVFAWVLPANWLIALLAKSVDTISSVIIITASDILIPICLFICFFPFYIRSKYKMF
jgi:hypothetical protein